MKAKRITEGTRAAGAGPALQIDAVSLTHVVEDEIELG